MKIKTFLLCSIIFLMVNETVYTQDVTLIPDPNFEQALIDLDIDTDGEINGEVLTADIETILTLNIIDKNIDSLNGIQGFRDLETLNCALNNIKNIDISANTALTSLNVSSNQISLISTSSNTNLTSFNCSSNQLSVIDISQNDLLTNFNCSNNRISLLDISNNDLLVDLTCSSNQLTNINVSILDDLVSLNCSNNKLLALDVNSNAYLKNLLCANNQIETLNIASNDSLTILDCSTNQISTLDVSNNDFLSNLTCSSNNLSTLSFIQNDSLVFLSCANNRLVTIDVGNNAFLENFVCSSNWLITVDVSSNTALTSFDVSSNLLEALDVSNNNNLTSLYCYENQLKTLNINNGSNGILTEFSSKNNPELYCIKVDDETDANNNTAWKKDDLSKYKEVCTAITYIPDDNFEQALIDLGFDTAPLDDFILTSDIENVIVLEISDKSISNLTGIQDFLELDTLDVSLNDLYNLDISSLVKLRYLVADTNNLVDLTIDNAAGILDTLNVTGNPDLTCIQVTDSTAAEAKTKWVKDITAEFHPVCISNKTYIPDDNFEQALIDLGYDNGSLDNYVLTDSIKNVTILDVSNKNISDLTGILDFALLDTLNCSANRLMALDVSSLDSLKLLSCYDNYLTSLNVENDTLLEVLLCNYNYLTALDLSKNLELLRLECNGNNLEALDLSLNTKLMTLNCNSNYITSAGFDLSANDSLVNLNCSNNKLTTLDLTSDTLLVNLDFSKNNISDIDLSENDSLRVLDCSYNNLSSLDLSENKLLIEVSSKSNQISALDFQENLFLRFLDSDANKLISLDVSLNDSLREVSVNDNLLPDLDVGNASFLRELYCADNLLDSLSFSDNDSLRILTCSNNNIPDLKLNTSVFLEELICNNNQLDSLILSANISLAKLSCTKNNLEKLDVSTNLQLEELTVDENLIEALDVSNNTALFKLSCSNNKLESLDLNSNTNLESLLCSTNELTTLVVQNGNNANLSTFQAVTNPFLNCIEVDDETQIGGSWRKDDHTSYANVCHYTETYIPDDNFESAVALAVGEPDNNDDYIETASIENLAILDLSSKGILDLTGIDAFVALSVFDCSDNSLDTLDLSNNTNLTSLNCAGNQLDTLVLTNNTLLESLDFSTNQVSEINIAHLVSLESLICNDNGLLILDLTSNDALIELNASSNTLERLHAGNGNNAILSTFDVTTNPLLGCIEVDDPDAANAGTGVYASWLVDPNTSYTLDCHYGETYVPNDAFEQVLKDLGYDGFDSDPLDDYVLTSNIEVVTNLYIKNKGISDLAGIEAFTALVNLNCSENLLTSLDFSSNLNLENLRCSNNQLTEIDVSANIILTILDVSDNLLTSLDISSNVDLENLDCSNNSLIAIDVVSNSTIITINCSFNQLVSVDANNGANPIITFFDLRNNVDLRCILVDDVAASAGYANWFKDNWSAYKLICNDDDNDGVPDVDDLCPSTPFGDDVDLFGCSIFILPADNFTVSTTSESCRSSNNGMVNISANAIHDYRATLIGNGITVTYDFTNTVEIRNVRAETYELCITIPDQPTYSVCYEIIITQPDDLYVEAKMSENGNSVTYMMSGGKEYTINFNGFVFTTTESQLTLSFEKGNNSIEIKADEDCQGIYTDSIFISDDIVAYPNPFKDFVNIHTNSEYSDEVLVEIYYMTGQLVHERYYMPQNGLIRLDMPHLKAGSYFVLLKSGNNQTSVKIIKE